MESEGQRAETSPAASAALSRVAMLLAKAAKSSRLYPSHHEIRRRFLEELHQSIQAAFVLESEVRFEIGKSELKALDESVYQAEGPDDVIPGRLYWDGLRELRLRSGLDREELGEFLQLLADSDSLRESGHDDLATLLWERGFSHISHVAIDDLLGATDTFDLTNIPAEFTGTAFGEVDMEMHEIVDLATVERIGEQTIRKLFSQPDSGEDSVHFTVPECDLVAIRHELAEESTPQRRQAHFFRILAEVLVLSDDANRAEIVELLHKHALRGLTTGEISLAMESFALLSALPQRGGSLGPSTQSALARALSLEIPPSLAAGVAKHFEAGPETLAHLARLVEISSPGAIPTFCEILGDFESASARKRLIALLVEKGHGHTELLAPFLEDSRWYLVRNVALILGDIGHDVAVDSLRLAISHNDPRVRKEVARAVSQCAGPGARGLLAHVLHDPDSTLRRWAARAFAADSSAAAPTLRGILESKEFANRDLEERSDFWDAYAYAARERAAGYFVTLLGQKTLWRPKHPEPVRVALCHALGIAGGSTARTALDSLLKDRSGAVRDAAEAALRKVDGETIEEPERRAA